MQCKHYKKFTSSRVRNVNSEKSASPPKVATFIAKSLTVQDFLHRYLTAADAQLSIQRTSVTPTLETGLAVSSTTFRLCHNLELNYHYEVNDTIISTAISIKIMSGLTESVA